MSGQSSGMLKNMGIVTAAMAAVALLIWSWTANMTQAPVQLGYYCLSCKKTEDIAKHHVNWRQYQGALSDSVLVCVNCNKGPAHPTNECEKSGSVFILHAYPDIRLAYDESGSPAWPKCKPELGQAAKAKGINLMPTVLNP